MTRWLLAHPVAAGFLLGVSDVVFRLAATLAFVPSDGRLFGPLLIGNVHHPNGLKAFGLGTLSWFGIAAIVLAIDYALVLFCRWATGRDYAGFRAARGLIAACAGVLALNVLESLSTGKVTDYVGVVRGDHVHAMNLGDIVLWLALAALPFALLAGYVAWLRDPRRAR